jgi:capsular exopolysaccharide synthesis family protein
MEEYPSRYRQNRVFPAPAHILEAPGFGYGWQPEPEQRNNTLLEYIHILDRKRKIIVLLALAGALAGFLVNIAALPVYRARTSLDIQSLNSDFLDMKAVSATGDSGEASTEAYVQTQIKMLQSDTLLEDTVRSLEVQSHVPYVERDDLLSQLKNALHLGHSARIPYSMLLRDAAARIKVKPLGLTRLVEITCDSWNADFSAKFCNALTDTFRNDDYATRGAEASKTSEWLTHQVADVRAQAEESEKKLEAATGGNGLVLSNQNTSVAEDRLRQVQEELVRAQADRMEKQAAYETGLSSPVDTLPSVIDNPNYRQSQQQLADLRDKVAQLVPPLTEENPKVIHLRSQIKELETEMEVQRGSIVGRLKDDYNAAKHREDLLRVTYDEQEANTSSELGKTNKVNLLRREVDSEQQLYQTLLQRAKEAGFASAMHVNTIRIVDAARTPKVPFSPQRGRAVGVGFLLGSLFGVSFAFYKERTAGTIRFPGEVQSRIHVQELGVIPSMRQTRGRLDAASQSLMRSWPGIRTAPPSLSAALASQTSAHSALHIWSEQFSIAAEAYRNTTFSILLASRVLGPAKMYVVSSPNAGEGKTTVVSNLGVALSQSQRRVVILDGDLRKPGLHTAFGIGNTTGLRNLLRGDINPLTAPLDLFCQKTSVANLSIVTSGSGSEEVTELLHSPRAADLLQRLGEEFDLVLIDTPPMLHMADARIFADHTDGVILVFRSGVTNLDQAKAAHEILVHDRVRVLGTILNDFDPTREGKSGYYKSYYQYKDAVEANTNEEAHV